MNKKSILGIIRVVTKRALQISPAGNYQASATHLPLSLVLGLAEKLWLNQKQLFKLVSGTVDITEILAIVVVGGVLIISLQRLQDELIETVRTRTH